MLHNAAQTYQSNQVTTSTPAELTLMLYNGAIKFVKQAKFYIEQKNFEKANESSLRVQDIITELINSLNRDYPISEQFLVMYEYLLRRVVESNMQKDATILDEVEGFLVEFRDTWKEAMALAKKQG